MHADPDNPDGSMTHNSQGETRCGMTAIEIIGSLRLLTGYDRLSNRTWGSSSVLISPVASSTQVTLLFAV
jgi:hypothetical protein